MNVLEFDNIQRAYKRDERVLDGVSFSMARGEVVGLLGRNGAGKTTLLRIAMGMIEAQQGSVRVFGADPREEPVAIKRRIGYVAENQILPTFLRVRDVIDLHRGLFPTWDPSLEREMLERFSVPMDRKVKSLSKGQARRLALLCAVAHRPELLLLDEPAGGLDPAARREFLETSIQLLNESGSTILFSSHYMGDVERLAGRVVMLDGGKVLIDSPLDDLREQYSVVLVPHGAEDQCDRLLALEDCVGVRRRRDALHAIFQLDADQSRSLLNRELGLTGLRCNSVRLEEMFIELMGGES